MAEEGGLASPSPTDDDGRAGDDRVCYLVLAHQTLWPVGRLVEAIRRSDPTAAVVVRHDQFTSGQSDAPLPEVEGAHVIGVAEPAAWVATS